MFTNTVFGVVLVYTYLALWDERPHLGGYDQAQAVTYVWLGQCLYATLAIQGGGFEKDLMERIRTGDIAVDLYRPADLQLWCLASDFGRSMFQLLGRGVIPFVFGSLFFPMALPTDVTSWAALLVSLLLAILVSFGIRYLAALSVFWLMDGTGINQATMILGIFCSGMVLPLNAFPGALGDIVRVLPWAAQIQIAGGCADGEDRSAPRVRLPGDLGGGAAHGGAADAVGGYAEGGGAGWLRRPERVRGRSFVTRVTMNCRAGARGCVPTA